MTIKVFLSVGRSSSVQQEEFTRDLESHLQSQGLLPQTVGRSYFTSHQPLVAVTNLMDECCGTVILAFERLYIESGIDRRGNENERKVSGVNLPTVWNQIEAAIAYSKGHPLLVIVENGLKEEGLLERGYDWYVLQVTLKREVFYQREFSGVFADWKRRVEEFQSTLIKPQVQLPSSPSMIAAPVQSKHEDKIKILFLTANPSDTNRLRLDHESKAIDQALRRSEFRDKFEFNQYQAVRTSDLQDCLLRFSPHIVHFSGHGSEEGEIILEDNFGKGKPVSERALSALFSVLRDNIRCVILNACFSERQANAIAAHIDCVIGMSSAIVDEAAISFIAAFYQALAYGRNVNTAFELGCVQIDLETLDQHDAPKLIAYNANPKEIVFTASAE